MQDRKNRFQKQGIQALKGMLLKEIKACEASGQFQTELKGYQTLLKFCDESKNCLNWYLNSNLKSDFQFNEEYNILVFAAAMIRFPRQNPSRATIGTFPIKKFLTELAQTDMMTYGKLITDGSQLRDLEDCRQELAASQSPFLKLISPVILSNYAQYEKSQKIECQKACKWHVEYRRLLRKDKSVEKKLKYAKIWKTWGSLASFIPFVSFFSSGLYLVNGLWKDKEKKFAIAVGVGYFFCSLIPIVNCLVNFLTCRAVEGGCKDEIDSRGTEKDLAFVSAKEGPVYIVKQEKIDPSRTLSNRDQILTWYERRRSKPDRYERTEAFRQQVLNNQRGVIGERCFYVLLPYVYFLGRPRSDFQFNEEYNALVFVAAMIKQEIQKTAVANQECKTGENNILLQFNSFMDQLRQQRDTDDETYQTLIDWGCYIQKHQSLLENLNDLQLASPKLLMNPYLYERSRQAKRLECYQWVARHTPVNAKQNAVVEVLTEEKYNELVEARKAKKAQVPEDVRRKIPPSGASKPRKCLVKFNHQEDRTRMVRVACDADQYTRLTDRGSVNVNQDASSIRMWWHQHSNSKKTSRATANAAFAVYEANKKPSKRK